MNIDAARSQLPPNLVPELFGLTHEYHTPSILADAIIDYPLLPSLAGTRLVHAFSGKRCSADAGSPQGTFKLIVSNPPYSERGAAALEDHDEGPGPGATACKSAHSEDDA